MKKRKRKAGGGRKSQGEFRGLGAVMSLRMPQDVHDKVAQAAKVSGRSLSQELLARANASFESKRVQSRDPALRAFSFLFFELAERICGNLGSDWRFDPWVFEAFRLALPKLLDHFRPRGEMKLPEFWEVIRRAIDPIVTTKLIIDPLGATKEERARIKKATQSPDAMADYVVQRVLSDFSDPRRAGEIYKDLMGTMEKMPEAHRRVLGGAVKQWETTYYGMTDARRDLAPKQKSK